MSTPKIIPAIFTLLAACSNAKETPTSSVPQLRLTPTQLTEVPVATTTIGIHGQAGIRNKVLFGDPSKRGFYSLLQIIPPGTTIPPHSHSDDHVGTVLSGTLRYGYGNTFNAAALKDLPEGSIYTEPAGANHFAQTTDQPVVIQYTGVGPLKTTYVNPADAPPLQKN
jgi:quercetin dioxygenase-like cupin family protein